MDRDKQGGEVILVLLDLSAALDTIVHTVFINRLKSRYGVGGTALTWFSSYLQNRSQGILVGDVSSQPVKITYGITGISVWPYLFHFLHDPPPPPPRRASLQDMGFLAWNMQTTHNFILVLTLKIKKMILVRSRIAYRDIKVWMASNYLVLNDDKTEIIHFTSRFAMTRVLPLINVGETPAKVTSQVRDLNVVLDSNLRMKQHVTNLSRGSTFALSRIGKFRRYLDQATTQKLTQAFVISRLDHCNSLLYGLPQKDINKLQRIQNMAARLISLTKKRDTLTPILHDKLHWLPVDQKIIFKIILLTYKVLQVLLLNTCLICSTFTFHHGPCGLAQCVPEIIFKLSGHVPRPTVIARLLLPPQYCGMHSLNTSGNYPMLLSSKAVSKLTFSMMLFLYNFLLFCALLFLFYLAHRDIF